MKWKCENRRFAQWPIDVPDVAECRRRVPMVFPDSVEGMPW